MRRDSFLLLLLLLLSPWTVRAADADLPPPDPPGVWHRLTHDDATTTSHCVGNPVTPLCGLETFLACLQRDRQDYCDLVESGLHFNTTTRTPPTAWLEYRIVYARRPSELDPVDRTTEGPLKPLPGDIIIATFERHCYSNKPAGLSPCSIGVEDNPPQVYMLRKQGDIWTNPYFFWQRF